MKITPIAAVLALVLCGAAHAQDRASDAVQRTANQHQRIAQGLKSGALSVREAGRLEREEQRIQNDLARLLAYGGDVDQREFERIVRDQQALGRDIRGEKHDSANANPNEISAQRLAEVVDRNVNQIERIARGLDSGDLSNREAARLMRGQARVSAMEAEATGDGYVGGAEQASIQNLQREQGQRIYTLARDDRGDRNHGY